MATKPKAGDKNRATLLTRKGGRTIIGDAPDTTPVANSTDESLKEGKDNVNKS